MWNTNKSPKEIIDEQDLEQINDEKALEVIINEVLKTSEKAVNEYKSGKEKALQSIVGKVMGKTRGRANPQLTLQLLKEKI